jgi:hypothetical protein
LRLGQFSINRVVYTTHKVRLTNEKRTWLQWKAEKALKVSKENHDNAILMVVTSISMTHESSVGIILESFMNVFKQLDEEE